ncbi:MAG TPA: alkaline phosphatase family protein [Nitrospirales bacterium]
MKVFHFVLLLLLLVMPSGCQSIGSIRTIATHALVEHELPSRHGITVGRSGGFKHVVIIAVDGLRADGFSKFVESSSDTPYLRTLLGVTPQPDGTFAYRHAVRAKTAITVFPSYTFPSWTSLVTGVYPGLHGITGNQLLFRTGPPAKQDGKKPAPLQARYYGEAHMDALEVYWAHLLNDDISPLSPTIYDVVQAANGQSLVVHHMISRGANDTDWRYPSYDTAVLYMKHEVKEYDHRTLYEFVSAFKALNGGSFPDSDSEVYLPTITTLYFPGLDHDSHMNAEQLPQRQQEYLRYVDEVVELLFKGADTLAKVDRKGVVQDRVDWPGLNRYPKLLNDTLFVLAADHGHSAITSGNALSVDELEAALKDVPAPWRRGRLNVHETSLTFFNFLTKLTSTIFYGGDPDEGDDIFVTLNGGSAAVYVKPPNGRWEDEVQQGFTRLVGEAIWDWFESNKPGVLQTIFVRNGSSYLECCKQGVAIPIEESSSDFGPDWKRRLRGLAPVQQLRPNSSPDLILLADRKTGVTFANHRVPWTGQISLLGTGENWKADHGHLGSSDSSIPLVFFSPRIAQEKLIPQMSIVDVAPTILDALGVYDAKLLEAGVSYNQVLARYPAYRGKSYYETIRTAMGEKATTPAKSSSAATSYKLHIEITPRALAREYRDFNFNFYQSTKLRGTEQNTPVSRVFEIEDGWEVDAHKIENTTANCGSQIDSVKPLGPKQIEVFAHLRGCPIGYTKFGDNVPTFLGFTMNIKGKRMINKTLDVFSQDIEMAGEGENTFVLTYPLELPGESTNVVWKYSITIKGGPANKSLVLNKTAPTVEGATSSIADGTLSLTVNTKKLSETESGSEPKSR